MGEFGRLLERYQGIATWILSIDLYFSVIPMASLRGHLYSFLYYIEYIILSFSTCQSGIPALADYLHERVATCRIRLNCLCRGLSSEFTLALAP